MGRWSHYDTDEERLPEGMQRIGYDADSQTYTYRDSDGSIWEGAPGNQYGKLFKVSSPPESWDNEKDFVYDDYSSSDEETLIEKADLPQHAPAKVTNNSPITRKPVSPITTKPLPPLPGSPSSKERKGTDKDFSSVVVDGEDHRNTSAPKGEEHRYKRRQARDGKNTLGRSGTISKITGYLSRARSSRESRTSYESEKFDSNKPLGRSATTREPPEKIGRRKRATTFDDILGSSEHPKE